MKAHLQFGILISLLFSYNLPGWKNTLPEYNLAGSQTKPALNLKTNPAFDNEVIYVVIDSLKDKDNRANIVWGENGYFLANDFFQKKLAADLKNDFGRRGYTIAFCTEDEARRDNIKADWRLSLDITYLYKYASSMSSVTIPVANETLASNTVHSTDNSFGWPGIPPTYDNVYTQFQHYTATSAEVRMILRLNLKNDLGGKDIRDKIKSKYGGMKHSETIYDSQSRSQDPPLSVPVSSMNSPRDNIAVSVLNGLYQKAYSDIKDNIEKAVN
ncbi:MAG: hypothetical protein M3015_17620 [Bacteroidota bacterium]|nr:hypothetical protein [Bacteroidota bacterium]